MKITQITIWLVLALGLLACGGKKTADDQTNQEVPAVTTDEMSESIIGDNIISYTCPMETHKHVHSDEVGNCPECGMDLIPMRLEKS
ncbi:heavy metal-binding domain-containing protein [Candidatus Neomarinimicrobiota bacterium]